MGWKVTRLDRRRMKRVMKKERRQIEAARIQFRLSENEMRARLQVESQLEAFMPWMSGRTIRLRPTTSSFLIYCILVRKFRSEYGRACGAMVSCKTRVKAT